MKEVDSGTPTYQGGRGGSATGGSGGTGAGGTGAGGNGAGGAGAAFDPLAPSIHFISPTPTTDPNGEDVVTGSSLTVRCEVEASDEPGASMVDKSAVKLVLRDSDDPLGFTNGVVSAISDTEFEATFDVSRLPNGPVTVECTGKDLTNHSATGAFTTLVDQGPKITLRKPQDKQSYALKTPMAIEIEVVPAPLGDSDNNAKVKDVALSIGGVSTPVTESSSTPGLYQTSIDFSDKNKFPVQPTSAQLQISASNERPRNAPTRIVRADVVIDGNGPSIAVTKPDYGSIQRGVVELIVTASDASGLADGSLVATINNKRYSDWSGVAPTFKLSFDTNQLDPKHELSQLTINVTAIDKVGNKTDPPVSHFVRLDNLPPVISLDPPAIREYRKSGSNTYCSQFFDPVGSDAADDLDNVLSAKLFRALVEDTTNHVPGATVDFHAGTNTNSVEMYTQGLSEVPLLVDTNGDGICDAVNKSDDMNIRDASRVTPDKDPTKIKLEAVNPAGQSWFAKPTTPNTSQNGCPSDPNGLDEAPGSLCVNTTDMSRAVQGRLQGGPPALYAFTPSNNVNAGVCAGDSWNIKGSTYGRDGWICVAARAVDNIGNVGVSEPLRLCFDDGEGAPPSCGGQPPTCTDGCTIDDAQRFAPAGQEFLSEIWPIQ